MSRTRTKVVLAAITPALLTGGIALAATSGGGGSNGASHAPRGSAATVRATHRRARGPLGALSHPLRSRLVSADVTLYVKGQDRAFQLNRGVVQSVSSSSIVLKGLDGTAVTVPVDARAHVRDMGKRASLTDIHSGEIALTLRPANGTATRVRAFQPKVEPSIP